MNIFRLLYKAAAASFTLALASQFASAQPSKEELALQLSNPISSLISVPFQLNIDHDIGPDEAGDRVQMNIQPVVPFDWNAEFNLISRTILPVVDQQDIFPGAGDQFGIGDVVQSFFLSPKAQTASGWTWGAGPVFLIPTATDNLLGADKWGIGPTGVALRQQGPWTYGALANHIWSFAGDDDRPDVNATFVQPFLSYTTPDAWTFGANMEATFDWENDDESIPLNVFASKVTTLGAQTVQIGGGLRYWLADADNGPDGIGFRINFVMLFPL